jgi:enoyl-CoA hydratase
MNYYTKCYMSIFNSLKPVVCQVEGYCIGGGSDIALCSDIIIMEETAKIGYPPVRGKT